MTTRHAIPRILVPIIVLIPVLLSAAIPSHAHPATMIPNPGYNDPFGSFQAPGPSAPLYWTGDGQRLNNTSFETGNLQPWIELGTNNATGSGANIAAVGYAATHSAKLTVFSGNFTPTSSVSLLNDLSGLQTGFGPGTRLRAAAYVVGLNGNSSADRVEVSITLTTSTGDRLMMRYVFGDGASLPVNGTANAYFKIQGVNTLGQWITLDRNIPADSQTVFPSLYNSINSVVDVRLTVDAQTLSSQNRDPHIKYVDANNDGVWEAGEALVYDSNLDSVANSGDAVLTGTATLGAALKMDPNIKFADANNNGIWDSGEPIVYDLYNNGMYNSGDPVIYGMTPTIGTLLETPIQRMTSSYFDQIELYTASGNYDWVRNGGFDTGTLTGWAANSTAFSATTSTYYTPTYSATGTITNGAAETAQSIDGRPQIGTLTRFKAATDITTLIGTTNSDRIDIWLGLVDKNANPVSIYYYFKTGDGTIPSNTTDTEYHKVAMFGTTNRWIPINASLLGETTFFNNLGYEPPYNVEVLVIEEVAVGLPATTTAYFDSFSILDPYKPGTAPSYNYAKAGYNSTYTYTTPSIPNVEFYLDVPPGQSVLNVTSPENTVLATTDYTAVPAAGQLKVDIPASTTFKHTPLGSWRLFTTSANSLTSLYAADAITGAAKPNYETGASVNLFSKSADPIGNPLIGAQVNITLWTIGGVLVQTWTGTANSQGWFNVTNAALPLTPGIYRLQATVQSSYVGLSTYPIDELLQFTVNLSLSAMQASQGDHVVISGAIIPLQQGVTITLSYRIAGNSQWANLTTVTTDANGKYAYTWTPPQGDYEIRASISGSQVLPAQSQLVELSVGPQGISSPVGLLYIAIAIAGSAIVALLIILRYRKKHSPKAVQ